MKLLIGVYFLLLAGAMPDARLTIKVTELRNDKGQLLVSIYNKATGFPGDPAKALRREKLAIKNGTAQLVIDDLPPGKYAVAILHDENENLRLDKQLGLPAEGYGFSNNAKGLVGPPPFSKAAFNLKEPQEIIIRARY